MASSSPRSDAEYIDAFWACFSPEQAATISPEAGRMRPFSATATTATYCTQHKHTLLKLADLSHSNHHVKLWDAVVIIENTDLAWISALGRAWDIPPSFFAGHASNPSGASPWLCIFGKSLAERKKPIMTEIAPASLNTCSWDKIQFWHVDGIYHYEETTQARLVDINNHNFIRRLTGQNPEHGLHYSTRISCCTCSNKQGAFCKLSAQCVNDNTT